MFCTNIPLNFKCFLVLSEAAALKNFTKLTGRHLCWSLFLNKVVGLACNFIEKEIPKKVFFCKFCEKFKKHLFYRTPPGDSF